MYSQFMMHGQKNTKNLRQLFTSHYNLFFVGLRWWQGCLCAYRGSVWGSRNVVPVILNSPTRWIEWLDSHPGWFNLGERAPGRLRLKRDGTRAETRFRLSAKRTSPLKSAGGVSSVDYWQPSCAHQR